METKRSILTIIGSVDGAKVDVMTGFENQEVIRSESFKLEPIDQNGVVFGRQSRIRTCQGLDELAKLIESVVADGGGSGGGRRHGFESLDCVEILSFY